MDVPPSSSGADAELDWRLAGLEGRLDAISERVERLESSLRTVVSEEVQAATADLRRVINELGRRLVKDLPQELARHRDTMVAQLLVELRPPPPPEPEPVEPDESGDPVDAEPALAEAEADPVPASVPSRPETAEQRRRASRLRRRHG